MVSWINYHHLLYFQMIAEEGSVSKAAEKLRLGQSTLSAQLKQFEETLGIKLFERHHKKLVITEQGKMALDYARQIFKLGNEMVEVLNDRHIPARPHLQIGAIDSVPKKIILRLSKEALATRPCQVSLIEGKPDELLRELSAHKIDIFLTNFLPKTYDLKGLNYRLLVKTPIKIYASSKFKNLRKNFPESLNNQHFILPTYDSKLRADLEHWFRIKDIQLDIIAETQDITLKKMMCIEGLGLIPAASHSVTKNLLNEELIEIGSIDNVFEELYMITAARKIANPLAVELMKKFKIEV